MKSDTEVFQYVPSILQLHLKPDKMTGSLREALCLFLSLNNDRHENVYNNVLQIQ
jgi:hypothetical protein